MQRSVADKSEDQWGKGAKTRPTIWSSGLRCQCSWTYKRRARARLAMWPEREEQHSFLPPPLHVSLTRQASPTHYGHPAVAYVRAGAAHVAYPRHRRRRL